LVLKGTTSSLAMTKYASPLGPINDRKMSIESIDLDTNIFPCTWYRLISPRRGQEDVT